MAQVKDEILDLTQRRLVKHSNSAKYKEIYNVVKRKCIEAIVIPMDELQMLIVLVYKKLQR